MIIDADVHISETCEEGNNISAEALIQRMDRAGVDKAVTWLQPPYLRHIEEANRYVYHAAQTYPDRILGFGWVDPHLGITEGVGQIHRCIEEYGFFGVKLNGAQNDFRIDDPILALPLIEEIAKTGTILALHVGGDSCENTHPYRVANIAKRYPELPILMVHMGGAAFHDLSSAAVEVAECHPNILLIGSAIRSISILKAIKKLGASRVCFGSDSPFELMHVEVAKYRAMLDQEATREEENLIMGGNIAALFGIQ